MKQETVSWEALNAYVDGELPPGRAAELARAIMRDPKLATQVAELAQLKAAASELETCPAIDLDLETLPASRGSLARAAIWLLLPLAAALLSAVLFLNAAAPASEVDFAIAAHHQWLEAPVRAAVAAGGQIKAALETVNIQAYVPDLSSAGLRFADIYPLHFPADGITQALHIGYLGPSGCKLSLLLTRRNPVRLQPLEAIRQGGETVYRWQIGQTGFLLLAARMDARRFNRIARAIYRQTQLRAPLDRAAILALNRAKANSLPCSIS